MMISNCQKCGDQIVSLQVEVGSMHLHIFQCMNSKCNHREVLNFRPSEDWDGPTEFWKSMISKLEMIYREWKESEGDFTNYRMAGFEHAREHWNLLREEAVKRLFKIIEHNLFERRKLIPEKESEVQNSGM